MFDAIAKLQGHGDLITGLVPAVGVVGLHFKSRTLFSHPFQWGSQGASSASSQGGLGGWEKFNRFENAEMFGSPSMPTKGKGVNVLIG